MTDHAKPGFGGLYAFDFAPSCPALAMAAIPVARSALFAWWRN